MDEKEWLGADNQLGLDIWKNKYCNDGETFDHWLDRVSGHDTEVAELLKQQKFLFGGRILANRGLEYKGKKITLSNCYVMMLPEDNIESILTGQENWPVPIATAVAAASIFPASALRERASIMRRRKRADPYLL